MKSIYTLITVLALTASSGAALGYLGSKRAYDNKLAEQLDIEIQQERVIQHITDTKGSTLTYNNLNDIGAAINSQAKQNPAKVENYLIEASEISLRHGYAPQIFDRFTIRESMDIANEVMKGKTIESVKDTEDLGHDFVERMKETDYYNNYLKKHEDMTQDAADKVKETKAYDKFSELADSFYQNVRRRVFREEE